MMGIVIEIIIVVVLIVLSALFSSSETALTTISPHRVRALVESGVKRADTLDKVTSKKEKMLSTILICNNIVNLAASALVTVIVQELFSTAWVSLGTGVLTVAILIFGEVSPKTMATIRAEKISLKYCGFINGLMVVLTPIVAAINFLSGGVLRLFGVKKDEVADKITEEELRTIVEVSNEEGIIENEEKEIINNVFDFSEMVAREIMVPRLNIVSINIDAKYSDVISVFRENLYTRLPVFEEEQIVGIVNVKDVMFINPSKFSVRDIMRKADYTFEQKHLSDLFMEMKSGHIQMIVVLDEYGDTAGIVTLEDLIEEIVGDIKDEYDQEEATEIVRISDGVYQVRGHVSLSDVNDALGTDFESEDFDSIGGILIENLGRIPAQGDSVNVNGITITATAVDGNRIEFVTLRHE